MKRIYYLFIILGTFFTLSCSSGNKDIIEKEKMAKVLADCYLADALIASKGVIDSAHYQEFSQKYYNDIFKKYNVTPVQFRESYNYYSTNFPEMKKIYEKVLNDLNSR